MMTSTAERIERAREAAGLTQRALAVATGIPQSTLSRIISGTRAVKVPELVVIAAATGHAVAELAGQSGIADRVQCAARATSAVSMDGMRRELLHYLELDAYLDDQGIPAA